MQSRKKYLQRHGICPKKYTHGSKDSKLAPGAENRVYQGRFGESNLYGFGPPTHPPQWVQPDHDQTFVVQITTLPTLPPSPPSPPLSPLPLSPPTLRLPCSLRPVLRLSKAMTYSCAPRPASRGRRAVAFIMRIKHLFEPFMVWASASKTTTGFKGSLLTPRV